jgi:hypothetical protein
MLLNKYILLLVSIIEFNYGYYKIPYTAYHNIHYINNIHRIYHMHNRNTERKADIIKNRCGYINNITEYIFELCAIIDIILPKK